MFAQLMQQKFSICIQKRVLLGRIIKFKILREGSDADLIVFDPEYDRVVSAKTHRHAVDFTAFEGLRLKGKATTTVVNGQLAFHNEEIVAKQGSGKYIPRKPWGWPYERVKVLDKVRDFRNFKVERDGKGRNILN